MCPERLSRRDIQGAYREILGRDADPSGLAHYLDEAERGLTREALARRLQASDEFANRAAALADLIDPADVIRALSLTELNATANEYYRRIPDATPLMVKPFSFWHEAPQMLQDLGHLLAGLHAGKGMTILDFGAGTCWLSRILAQLQCQPIAVDVSSAALDIGRRVFAEMPLTGTSPYTPQFLVFDGHRIDVPDASVDRIVCFDAFHHVPNQADVIGEFARVLKPGGVAGFSEPGREHSMSAQSQFEMKHHRVLENNIDLPAIFALARPAGFTSMTIKALVDRSLSLEEYTAIIGEGAGDTGDLQGDVWSDLQHTLRNRSIFFLHKGPLRRDSRTHEGLAHRMQLVSAPAAAGAGTPFTVTVRLENTGTATWLHQGREIFGLVRFASHLYREPGHLVNLDFTRQDLSRSVEPGESIEVSAEITLPESGTFRLVFDLVAEGVTWFENVGAEPVSLVVSVAP